MSIHSRPFNLAVVQIIRSTDGHVMSIHENRYSTLTAAAQARDAVVASAEAHLLRIAPNPNVRGLVRTYYLGVNGMTLDVVVRVVSWSDDSRVEY